MEPRVTPVSAVIALNGKYQLFLDWALINEGVHVVIVLFQPVWRQHDFSA
jgi:hypothetical protein